MLKYTASLVFWALLLWISIQESKAVYRPEKIFVKNVNLEQGLSQCVVTDILQDYKGFIWAATFDGLNRYDGQNMKIYRHDPEDTNSVISSKIFRLSCDSSNHLYMLTANGFSIFDCSAEKTLRPAFLKQEKIEWICSRNAREMWIYVKGKGLMTLGTQDFQLHTIPNADQYQLKGNLIHILVYGNQVNLVSHLGEVIQYNPMNATFNRYQMDSPEQVHMNSAGLDKFGNIILGSRNSDLIIFNNQTKKYKISDLFLQNGLLMTITDVVYDPYQDVLYLSSYGQGLFIYDYSTQRLTQYKKNESQLLLSSMYPDCLYLTHQGSLLMGYDGMGFDLLDAHIKQFTPIYKDDPDDFKSLKFIRKLIEGNYHQLFIGTSGSGLIRYDRIKGTFEFFNNRNAKNYPDNFVIELIRIKNELYLGYNGTGIGVVDVNTVKPIKTYTAGKGPNQLSDGTIWSFVQDQEGYLWVGTRENGLNRIDLSNGKVKQFTASEYPEFENNGLRCLYDLDARFLLIGSEKGLYQMDKSNFNLTKVFPLTVEQSNSFNSIKCITRDKYGNIWLGTDGSGIVVLSKSFNLIKNFHSGNFLNNSVVYSLLAQNDSIYWLSTNAGISKLTWNQSSLGPQGTVKVSNYDESNGLQANEFNTGAYAQLSDGYMAFGGIKGINIFHPNDISATNLLPNTYISEFKVFENSYYKGTNVAYLNRVDLKHYENSISISFSTLGFVLPERTKYQYRLIGHEDKWILAGNRNYISYTNLHSGDYEFQVKACNYDGVWNDNYTSLYIHIETPFYRSFWFVLLVGCFILQLIYMFYRYRVKQNKEKEELRIQYTKELAEVEMKALRAQINPHFLFNSLNSINNYILKNDTKKASRYLVKFSQLVRNILNNSSNSFITLQEELQTIELYMLIEGMRFNDQFTYAIENVNGINTANITIPSLLLQPYVENAIWHGLLHKEGFKQIIIRIEQGENDDYISVNIIDNGVGRKKAEEIENKPKQRKSYGMQLGENRLKLMGQNNGVSASVEIIDLVDDQMKPIGTQIKIIIPSNYYNKPIS